MKEKKRLSTFTRNDRCYRQRHRQNTFCVSIEVDSIDEPLTIAESVETYFCATKVHCLSFETFVELLTHLSIVNIIFLF